MVNRRLFWVHFMLAFKGNVLIKREALSFLSVIAERRDAGLDSELENELSAVKEHDTDTNKFFLSD